MNELNVITVALITLGLAYLVIYPRFAGNDVKKLAWLDATIGALLLAGLAPFYWSAPTDFTYFFFDTSWWIFTILVYGTAELPFFFLYVKARGIGEAYLDLYRNTNGVMGTASRKSVERQLVDTKWDGLRSRSALRFLVVASNVTMLLGAVALWQLEDNAWAAMTILYIAAIAAAWFLLRQAVRLIPDAPRDLLDERMLRERDSAYSSAYQGLAAVVVVGASAFLALAIAQDFGAGDGFTYEFTFTWPQVQAIFWLSYGYALMLPSMAMASREARRLALSAQDR